MISSVSFYTGTGQSAFSEPVAIGLPVFRQLFEGAGPKQCFTERVMQAAASYVGVTYGTARGAGAITYLPDANYHLVSEDGFENVGGGVIEYDRLWVRNTLTDYSEWGTVQFRFPAVHGSPVALSSYQAVSTYSLLTEIGTDRMFIPFVGTFTPGIGDYVAISFAISAPLYAATQVAVVPVRDQSVDGVIVDVIPSLVNIEYRQYVTGLGVSRSAVGGGRTFPLDTQARCYIEHKFSQSAPTMSGITKRQQFLLSNGQEVDFVSPATIPSSASYVAWVTAGTTFCASDTEVSRVMGNLYRRSTYYVVAQ